ncbi:multicopper oxidase family protein [Cryobacterium serini]|uniref:multicopper oxidase family protein n=1 Tax=Cryobacterium serini TaxID=1259201 RepID=UPI0030B9F558
MARTALNVYSGLAAQYHLHDPLERALLPQGEFDVSLTINDAMFAVNGALGFDDNDRSGLWGDVILVNGRPWPVMKVKKRIYRFRVMNSCISRSLRPSLSTGDPVTIVATDGGLMPVSQSVASWRHSPAERYEILIDFRKYTPGQRSFRINRKNGLWTVNGGTWEQVVASEFRDVLANPNLNAVEIWEFAHNAGGWFHPMHFHLIDFKILSRSGRAPFSYEKGPKDVVYVGENESVKLLMQFGPHRGRYMIHCHNTVHEDHDMMVQFRVGPEDASDRITNNPITAARAEWDTSRA